MSEEKKQPIPEEDQPQEMPKQEAPQAEETAEKTEKSGKAKKKKEKAYSFTREQVEQMELAAKQLESVKEQFVRLNAEYDNYRKRSQKEKTDAYQNAKSDAVLAFLPVYDNLERALKQSTADEAYKKGVEMTMAGLKEVLAKQGVEEIPALGQPFDPNVHNAVMHVEDESAGENTVVEVFQTGFRSGEKIIRFAMVKVAN